MGVVVIFSAVKRFAFLAALTRVFPQPAGASIFAHFRFCRVALAPTLE
jgi:hypothetical protein